MKGLEAIWGLFRIIITFVCIMLLKISMMSACYKPLVIETLDVMSMEKEEKQGYEIRNVKILSLGHLKNRLTRQFFVFSKQTARSKGYAFVEFASDEVAKIVAETMHNYMMFGRLLKCEYRET